MLDKAAFEFACKAYEVENGCVNTQAMGDAIEAYEAARTVREQSAAKPDILVRKPSAMEEQMRHRAEKAEAEVRELRCEMEVWKGEAGKAEELAADVATLEANQLERSRMYSDLERDLAEARAECERLKAAPEQPRAWTMEHAEALFLYMLDAGSIDVERTSRDALLTAMQDALPPAPVAPPEQATAAVAPGEVAGLTEKDVAGLLYSYLSDSDLPDDLVPDFAILPWAKEHAPALLAKLTTREAALRQEIDSLGKQHLATAMAYSIEKNKADGLRQEVERLKAELAKSEECCVGLNTMLAARASEIERLEAELHSAHEIAEAERDQLKRKLDMVKTSRDAAAAALLDTQVVLKGADGDIDMLQQRLARQGQELIAARDYRKIAEAELAALKARHEALVGHVAAQRDRWLASTKPSTVGAGQALKDVLDLAEKADALKQAEQPKETAEVHLNGDVPAGVIHLVEGAYREGWLTSVLEDARKRQEEGAPWPRSDYADGEIAKIRAQAEQPKEAALCERCISGEGDCTCSPLVRKAMARFREKVAAQSQAEQPSNPAPAAPQVHEGPLEPLRRRVEALEAAVRDFLAKWARGEFNKSAGAELLRWLEQKA